MERPHCAPQRSSRKHVSDESSSTSLISSCTTPSACGGAGFSHFGLCTHPPKTQSSHKEFSFYMPKIFITDSSSDTNASSARSNEDLPTLASAHVHGPDDVAI